MDLVGTAEIADMLGVSRERVHQLTKQSTFPAPLAVLRMGKVWNRAHVQAWMAKTGRTPDGL